jgi:hypothetical protein
MNNELITKLFYKKIYNNFRMNNVSSTQAWKINHQNQWQTKIILKDQIKKLRIKV